jgi:hypothetical protein
MATKNQNDSVCTTCGCEICIVTEPSRSGYSRANTYCPVCKNPMVKRSALKKTVCVSTLMQKFGLKTYSDERSVSEKLSHARYILQKGGVQLLGVIGASKVFLVPSEDSRHSYIVTTRDGFYNCNCPDQMFRHGPCKHIIATMLHEEAKGNDPFK